MIRTWKCWLGAFAVCALLSRAGSAQLIEGDAFGTARVQPDPLNAMRPADGAYEPIWLDDFQPPPGVGVDAVTVPQDGGVGYAVTNDIEAILYRIGRVNRHYPGLEDDGFTSAGAFIPVQVFDGNSSLIAINPRAFVSDNGRGGINFGLTARRYSPQLKRVFVLSNWFDYDQAGHEGYAQYGIHAATIGQYWSLRGNINLPVGESSNVLHQNFTTEFINDQLVVHGVGKIEMAYQQYEAEFAVPVPYFARYGFELGMGYYYLNGADNGGEDGHGVSTRVEAQVTEDLWANALVTSDGVFGSNLSLNFELTLPNGSPSRMMRRLPVQQYLMATDRRSHRVMRDVARYESHTAAIDPNDGDPLRVAHIDPNGGVNGSSGVSPFGSIFQFESLPDGTQDDYDIIVVRGRNDGSDTNLNTTITLFDGQQLLGTGIPHIVDTANRGPVMLPDLPFETPYVTNSGAPGLDVVRLADMNVVSGLFIDAGGTANGINGLDAGDFGVRDFNINRNLIRNAIIGIDIAVETTVTGEDMTGIVDGNTIELTTDDGLQVVYDGVGVPVSDELDLQITNNIFQGTEGQAVDIDASGNAVINLDIADNELFLLQQNQFITETNFLGSTIYDSGFIPPDTMGAVGMDHIVEMLNGAFAIYDKDTGALISRITLDEFWTDVAGVLIPAGDLTFDPRIIYDPTVDRYFAVSIDGGAPAAGIVSNNVYVAVSATDDPTGDWHGFQFVADSVDGVRFNDYVTLGVDARGIYMATNNFLAPTSTGADVSLYYIPKADLLAPSPTIANMQRFENLNSSALGYGFTLQPAVDFGTEDGTEILSNPGSGTILIETELIDAGGGVLTITLPDQIVVPAFATAPPGQQPNSPPLENVSPRFTSNVVKVGGSLWASHTVTGVSGRSAVRWYEIDADTNAVLQTGLIEDPELDFLDASIAVNEMGQVLIGFTGTGDTQFPSSMAVMGETDGGVTTFGTPEILAPGLGDYFVDFGSGRNRWGDYSATMVDPESRNGNHFWTFQELVVTDDVWGVQITEVVGGLGGGGGIRITANDTATITGDISRNTITGGTGNGLEIIANDASVIDLSGSINDNVITGSSGSGMFFASTGTATLEVEGARNSVTGNGENGLFMQSFGTSVLSVDFANSQFDENTERGVQAEANDGSTLVFRFNSPVDPLAAGPASASNNTLQGINLKGFDAATIDAIIDGAIVDGNGDAGISVTMEDDSIGLVDILNSDVIDSVDGAHPDFGGEGVVFRTFGDSSLVATITDSFIDGNFGNGVRAQADGTSFLDLTIDPTIITNNGTEANPADGIVIDRRGSSIMTVLLEDLIVENNRRNGLTVLAAGASTGAVADLTVTSNRNSFSENVTGDGINYNITGAAAVYALHTLDVVDANGADGVDVTTNVSSFFGFPPAPPLGLPSVFDSLQVTGNGANGYVFTQNGNSTLLADITSNAVPMSSLIELNTLDGIEVNHAGTGGLTSVRIGDAANAFPDVTINQNLVDAVDINITGSGGVANVSIANSQINGARLIGSPADPGVTVNYSGSNVDAEVWIGQDMGDDHTLGTADDARAQVVITDIGALGDVDGDGDLDGDGVDVLYNPEGIGDLRFLMVGSIVGGFSGSIGGDGVDIRVQDDGFIAEFYENVISGAAGDGVRFTTMAEDINGSFASVIPDIDTTVPPNGIGELVSPLNPGLLARPDYVFPWGDSDAIDFDTDLIFGDPLGGPGFGGNIVTGNTNGLVLAVGAATEQNVIVHGNDLRGNTTFDFVTATLTNNIATQALSTNVGTEGAADTVVLDPLAHLNLFFGDSTPGGENINIGNTLNPSTVGGVWTAGDVFKGAGRAILADFQVVVPDEVFPPADNIFTLFGTDTDESALFLGNGYNVLPGIGTIQ